ncbi:Fic family protein [Arthrobacter sp. zg-Y1110]|uniref:Fic family protein n=1 Tax=Arthrobacter sp. zg-Y1110 TaxID=2886932 RepID=UPI001D13DB5B|nr:Fic family protein [Arthrobacter sp. zg-Y1110]MCC3292409.1 Fic family protein [Arthrobacter sp. zg-Y1110]UWX87155.1 Fic family protein [Arthrobacter sp. zg-Y1110]
MGPWPAHEFTTVPYKPSGRVPREDRMLAEISPSVPPRIAGVHYYPERETMVLLEEAAVAMAALDAVSGPRMRAISGFLLRSEAVSSSKIEHVEAARDDVARAIVGVKASENARSVVAATDAIASMIADAGATGSVRSEALLKAHHTLMKDDPVDFKYAGRYRDVQNWIGGSDYTPLNAIHIPPVPDEVQGLMDDLLSFCNRSDIPVLAQAAIAHAQFESIHPFTDGNGRIGRAIIGSIARRRNLTRQTVTPIASAMVADVDCYFSLVNAYRTGDLEPFVVYLASSAVLAVEASRESIHRLEDLPAEWMDAARPRRGSADEKLIASLLEVPVFDAETAAGIAGVATPSIYGALDRLTEAGVLHPLTKSKRYRAWAATEVLDEVERLTKRLSVPAA